MVKEAKHIYLADLHFEHKVWLNEFDFFKDEIQIFSGRMTQLESRNNSADFSAAFESLQNRLIRQKEVLDELRHDVKIHEHNLASFAEEHPIAVDHVFFTDHSDLRSKVTRFKELYTEFKDEFNRFSAKWM
jgi:hypothetical protein